jgi:hypothetical protein
VIDERRYEVELLRVLVGSTIERRSGDVTAVFVLKGYDKRVTVEVHG